LKTSGLVLAGAAYSLAEPKASVCGSFIDAQSRAAEQKTAQWRRPTRTVSARKFRHARAVSGPAWLREHRRCTRLQPQDEALGEKRADAETVLDDLRC